MIAGDGFLQAWLIQSRLPTQQTVRFELRSKAARHAYSVHLWDAQLIKIPGENYFLISYERDSTEWLPCDRMKYNEDVSVVVAEMRKRETPQGLGIQATVETELKRGQKAFKFWGSSWDLVTIKEITVSEVHINWDSWWATEGILPSNTSYADGRILIAINEPVEAVVRPIRSAADAP